MLVRQFMHAAMIVRNLVFALHIRQIQWLCYCDSNDCSIQSVDGAKESNSIPVPRSFGELKLQRWSEISWNFPWVGTD